VNIELGRRVLEHVTTHRSHFDMGIWGLWDPECGTTACLAGWAMLLSGYRVNAQEDFIRPDGSAVRPGIEGDEAAGLLDLSYVERYGSDEDECSLFTAPDEDTAIERFRALVEAAEESLLAAREPRQ
jgi:hypothetical protein